MMEGKAKFGMPKQNGNKLLSLRKIALLGAIEQPVKISSSHFAEAIESSMQTAARRLQELDTEADNSGWAVDNSNKKGDSAVKGRVLRIPQDIFSFSKYRIRVHRARD